MKNIKQAINAFEKQLVSTRQQIRQHNKSLLDYAQVLREYAQYLFNTQIIEHEIAAVLLAKKVIRCYGCVYRNDPKKFQATYAKVLVEWFDYMNLYEDYEVGITLAEKALVFYQPLLQKHKRQYLPDYAKLLADYGYCLWMDKQVTQAQEKLSESLNIYKSLFKKDSTQLLAYCHAQFNYTLCLESTHKEQARGVMVACLELLQQATDQQSLAFKTQKVRTLEFYIKLLDDDLIALTLSEQLVPLYQELISLDFKSYARSYADFLVSYANCSEANVWTDGYDGFYDDSPRLALADKLLAESVEVREQLITTGALYEDWGYIRTLKRYTEFLLEQEHPDRAVNIAKKAMDFAKKIIKKENISIKSMDELNYARTCQLYARALGEQGEYNKAANIALQGLFWYEQLTLMNAYYLEELCFGIYEPDDYTNALEETGSYLDNIGKTQQALVYLEKAYLLAKRRYDNNQTMYYLRRYLEIFNDYINLLNDNGHTQQALVYSNELLDMAVKHYEIKEYQGSYPPLLVNAYGNNGYILASNQRYEEALTQTKKALACNGLVWYGDGVSYNKNKTWLLNNLACYQNELGEGERGLKNAKKSLAIRLQLFKESPLHFLSALQFAHRNCAFILKELGCFNEALAHRKQILELDKKYQLTSSWFDQFEVRFLNWLNGKKVKPFGVVNMANEELELREKQELNFKQYWLLTCLTPSHDYLTRALYYFTHMDKDLQHNNLDKLFILMSLLKQRHWILPESLQITQAWQADYQQYIKQRKGFVPRWMLTAAEKLNCTLPATT